MGPLEKDDRGVWASEGLNHVLGFIEGDRITVDGAQYVFNGYLANGGMQGLMVLPGHPLVATVVAEQYLFGPTPLPDQVADLAQSDVGTTAAHTPARPGGRLRQGRRQRGHR